MVNSICHQPHHAWFRCKDRNFHFDACFFDTISSCQCDMYRSECIKTSEDGDFLYCQCLARIDVALFDLAQIDDTLHFGHRGKRHSNTERVSDVKSMPTSQTVASPLQKRECSSVAFSLSLCLGWFAGKLRSSTEPSYFPRKSSHGSKSSNPKSRNRVVRC